MSRSILLPMIPALAVLSLLTGAVGPAAPVAAVLAPPAVRLPGFAAQLAERPLPAGPDAWGGRAYADAWGAIARSDEGGRQAARWDYAAGLIAQADAGLGRDYGGPAGDALGVLDIMARDDPDLMLVGSYRLARGIALVRLDRMAEALSMLTDPVLMTHGEACLWRMVAHQRRGEPRAAMNEVRCAAPAFGRRTVSRARPFLLALGAAGVEVGRHAAVLAWLGQLPDRDASANLLRGRALIALGRMQDARLRLDRVRESGGPGERAAAELALVEARIAARAIAPRDSLKALSRITFVWRGDGVEQRALRLGLAEAERAHDSAAALAHGAALLRYHTDGADAPALLAACQRHLANVLAPAEHGRPALGLADAIGLFWDYRDLAPTGTQGDAMLATLAGRLADARLYERAADLLVYQMNARAKDIEKGPVSERAARYYILAGKPGRAIAALRASDQVVYPDAITNARRTVEAVALFHLGESGQAISLLDDMPDRSGLRSEMLWRRRDWQGLVARLGGAGPARVLNPVQQAEILRQAVALVMLGREGDLGRLRARYGAAFAASPSAAAFALLTGPVDAMTSERIGAAMAAIPGAAVAGEYEAMLNARPATPGTPVAPASATGHK